MKEQLLNVQGLILSGGHDVDPHNYGEEPEQNWEIFGLKEINLICAS